MVFNILSLIFFSILTFNCGSNNSDLSPEASKSIIKGAPDWYLNTPIKEGFIVVPSSATSQDMQLAVNKATLDAANTLASMIKSDMNALLKRVREEIGTDDDSSLVDTFSQVQEQVVSTSINNYNISKKQILREKNNDGKNIFRAYVFIEWDENASNEKILEQIKSDKALYDLMRTTELYDEMSSKVEKYKKKYRNQ